MAELSRWLRSHRDAASPAALARIRIAMARLPNVLEREVVACQKTLEQKISDQGPSHLRVDPHLLGLALRELTIERRILRDYQHPATAGLSWYANARTSEPAVREKLEQVAPLYAQVSGHGFGNFVGDALELVVFKSLAQLHSNNPRYSYLGSFHLDAKRTKDGRYRKTEPPQSVAGRTTKKRPDFILFGPDSGPVCIECKNYREWIYPHHGIIADLIIKSLDLNMTPALIARRIHYTTIKNLLEPAGILAHESYYQYYLNNHADLAARVRHKRSLGFTDVRAAEEPDQRTVKFFANNLLRIIDKAAQRFNQNRDALTAYVEGEIHLAQLYNEIGSPAAGNWTDPADREPEWY